MNYVTSEITSRMPGIPTVEDTFLGEDEYGLLPLDWEFIPMPPLGPCYFNHLEKRRSVMRPCEEVSVAKIFARMGRMSPALDDTGQPLPDGWIRYMGRYGISFYVFQHRIVAIGSPVGLQFTKEPTMDYGSALLEVSPVKTYSRDLDAKLLVVLALIAVAAEDYRLRICVFCGERNCTVHRMGG
jgi:hypothetical protein